MIRKTAPLILLGGLLLVPCLGHCALSSTEMESIADKKGLKGQARDKFLAAGKGAKSATIGAGPTKWKMTREECRASILDAGKLQGGPDDVAECGSPYMAKVPGEKTCIDRFEWPNIPCEYPVTWATAKEAAQLCEAEGKRLCDAHEWEASCSGLPQPEDYVRGGGNAGRKEMWAYGDSRRGDLCGFGSTKSPGCDAALISGKGVVAACGVNAWPAGSFPECKSTSGVYDLHGNLAEHMNLAGNPSESGKKGGHGSTEMKGSWFVFPASAQNNIHKDDCLWREPGWHRTKIMDDRSHANYHLGFRCCSRAN